MRPRFPQQPVMTAFMAIALVASLCGEAPQEGRVPRSQPQPPSDMQAMRPMPTPSQTTTTTAPDRPQTRRHGVEGRTPRPLPPHRVGTAANVSTVALYPGTRVVVPPPFDRCTAMPGPGYWRRRDIMAEIKWLSRSGFIPVTAVGDGVDVLTDYAQKPAGWRAYGIAVPAGGTLQVEVQHGKVGWFRLMLVNKWGEPGPGMLQAAIAHQPILVTYKNPGSQATAVYVIVDDPAWWSDEKDPYTLLLRRDWDPAKTDLSQVKMVEGLWGASPSVSAQYRGPSLTGPAVFPR